MRLPRVALHGQRPVQVPAAAHGPAAAVDDDDAQTSVASNLEHPRLRGGTPQRCRLRGRHELIMLLRAAGCHAGEVDLAASAPLPPKVRIPRDGANASLEATDPRMCMGRSTRSRCGWQETTGQLPHASMFSNTRQLGNFSLTSPAGRCA